MPWAYLPGWIVNVGTLYHVPFHLKMEHHTFTVAGCTTLLCRGIHSIPFQVHQSEKEEEATFQPIHVWA
jgi:hypothetical protein